MCSFISMNLYYVVTSSGNSKLIQLVTKIESYRWSVILIFKTFHSLSLFILFFIALIWCLLTLSLHMTLKIKINCFLQSATTIFKILQLQECLSPNSSRSRMPRGGQRSSTKASTNIFSGAAYPKAWISMILYARRSGRRAALGKE